MDDFRGVDISGIKFNRLTAVAYTPKRVGRAVVWEWRCDCGKTIYRTAGAVKLGLIKSCGCLHAELSRQRIAAVGRGLAIDLKGKRFGRLTVKKKTKERSGSSVVWLCVCDCGSEVLCPARDLRRGHYKSCGCFSRERARETGKKLMLSDKGAEIIAKSHIVHFGLKISDVPHELIQAEALRIRINRELRKKKDEEY